MKIMELTELYNQGKKAMLAADYGFFIQGVETGWVLKNNRTVMDSYALRQRAINGPETADTKTTVLEETLLAPVIMSAMTMPIPAMAQNGLFKVSRALKRAGSMMWTGSPMPKELSELVCKGAPHIQSVKCYADREKILRKIEHCREAGVRWVGIEVDTGQGTKVHDRIIASDCRPPSLDFLRKVRDMTPGKLVFKGVLSKEDAALSLEAGADAVMVSNHGAHTIDYLPHPLQVLPEISRVIRGRIPIFVDGGFRRGTDVFKALALGADLVGLGRPVLYGLAADGEEGVFQVINQITLELKRVMVMTGVDCIEKITPDCLLKLGGQ